MGSSDNPKPARAEGASYPLVWMGWYMVSKGSFDFVNLRHVNK